MNSELTKLNFRSYTEHPSRDVGQDSVHAGRSSSQPENQHRPHPRGTLHWLSEAVQNFEQQSCGEDATLSERHSIRLRSTCQFKPCFSKRSGQ